MKKITSLFLALIMLCLTPLTTIAYAQQLDEYGGVVVYIPLDMELLEKKFREYVKNAAAYYYDQADQGASFSYSKYYYEAADLKAAFDSEKNIFGGSKQGDLAYNTQESVSKRDYEQETREITLYMLSQDVQNKADQLKALSPAEKASFYPGIMLDPITGDLTVNKQAVIAQEQYNSDVQKQIDDGVADATMLLVNTAVDVGLGIGGVNSKKAYELTDTVTDLLESVWKYDVQMRYDEEQKKLKNQYRDAMIADIAAAQQNVDAQMFEGLYALRDELKKKSAADTETKILIDSLDQLLSAIEESMHIDSVLAKSVNGSTVQAEIERIAAELVDDAGMTEQEIRSENEMLVDFWAYAVTEALLSVAFEVVPVPKTDNELIEDITNDVKDLVEDLISDGKNELFDLSDANLKETFTKAGKEIFKDVGKALTEKLIDKLSDAYLKKQQKGLKDAQSFAQDAQYKYQRSRSKHEAQYIQMDKKRTALISANDVKSREKKIKEWEEKQKKWKEAAETTFFGALVDDGLQLVECTLDLFSSMASLGDMGDSEVTISYVSSAMYRAKELAEEGRNNVLLNYASMANQSNIDQAALGDLKKFLDSMYVVLNTDLLGESYYATLCAWQEYQHDPEEWDRVMAEKQALLDAKYEAAWDRGFAFGSVYTLFTPIYGGIGNIAAWICMGDSEYLKKVDKESKLGSWLSSDSAVSKYNTLAEIVSSAYEFPALYEPLFK